MKQSLNAWENTLRKWTWKEALLASWEQSSLAKREHAYLKDLSKRTEKLRKTLRISK